MALSLGKSFYQTWDLPHTCRICKQDKEVAKGWGCLGPTEEVQFYIPCQACDGQAAECSVCGGAGYEPICECPQKLVTPESLQLVYWHRYWPGTLPFAGGAWDQPALYVSAMQLLDWGQQTLQGQMQAAEEQRRRVARKRG